MPDSSVFPQSVRSNTSTEFRAGRVLTGSNDVIVMTAPTFSVITAAVEAVNVNVDLL